MQEDGCFKQTPVSGGVDWDGRLKCKFQMLFQTAHQYRKNSAKHLLQGHGRHHTRIDQWSIQSSILSLAIACTTSDTQKSVSKSPPQVNTSSQVLLYHHSRAGVKRKERRVFLAQKYSDFQNIQLSLDTLLFLLLLPLPFWTHPNPYFLNMSFNEMKLGCLKRCLNTEAA